MSELIPDLKFRLAHNFSITPPLTIDDGPARGVLVGQNAERKQFEAIFLGKHAETPHRGAWLDVRGAHVLYVMGKRRSGKSYTLGVVAEALVSDSWIRQGEHKQAVLILDTMNVFLTMPFPVHSTFAENTETYRDLVRWGLRPESPPLSMYAPAGTAMPAEFRSTTITLRASDLAAEEWCGLFDIDPFVDPMGHLLTMLLAKLESGSDARTRDGSDTLSTATYQIQDMIDKINQDADLQSYSQDTRDALVRRLTAVQKMPLFGPNGLDIRSLLKPGQLSVLLLRDLDARMRTVMVSLITKKTMQLRAISEQQERLIPIHLAKAAKYESSDPDKAKQARERAGECAELAKKGLPRAWLIIDEAHNYIPAREKVPSRGPLKKYVDEGRNLGLSIVVATQQPSGLDPSIQRNADMLLIHSLSHRDDIAAALGMINTSEPDSVSLDAKQTFSGARLVESLVRTLPIGYALVSTDRASRLFPIQIRPRITVHGGSDY